MKKLDLFLCILLVLLGMGLIVLMIKYLGLLATILVLVAVIGWSIVNENHNPINLYFKHYKRFKR